MRTYRYWLYPVWWSGLGLWGDTKEQCEDGLHLNMGQGLQSVCVCVCNLLGSHVCSSACLLQHFQIC